MYRVCYRQRANEPWQHQEFASRADAYARKAMLRRRLWSAFVQMQDAAGDWIDT